MVDLNYFFYKLVPSNYRRSIMYLSVKDSTSDALMLVRAAFLVEMHEEKGPRKTAGRRDKEEKRGRVY